MMTAVQWLCTLGIRGLRAAEIQGKPPHKAAPETPSLKWKSPHDY
jgi:hypothetical protein